MRGAWSVALLVLAALPVSADRMEAVRGEGTEPSPQAADIDFQESWQIDGAAANDGFVWEDDYLLYARLNEAAEFECWDFNQNGWYDACWASSPATLAACRAINETYNARCNLIPCYGTGANAFHFIDYAALGLIPPEKVRVQVDYE